ncbi:hypothetical protein GYH30_044550 [Glycine max]|nr:hypothetical protein GYH30_044550 [Glycine max]
MWISCVEGVSGHGGVAGFVVVDGEPECVSVHGCGVGGCGDGSQQAQLVRVLHQKEKRIDEICHLIPEAFRRSLKPMKMMPKRKKSKFVTLLPLLWIPLR